MSDKEQSTVPTSEKSSQYKGESSRKEKLVGYFELLGTNANFRWLWSGQLVSLLGDWFNLIASALLIRSLTDSKFALGVLFTIRMLAPFFISPIAGICADRYNRKHILIISDIIRGLLILGFLFVRTEEDIPLLYVLTTLLFGVSGFFSPARSAILPDITSTNELGTANALSATTWSIMLALGAAIGGFTAGVFGIQTAFIVDGLTFFVSAILLLQIKLPQNTIPSTRENTGRKFTTFRYLIQEPDLFFIALHKASIALILYSGYQISQVEIAKSHFVIGVEGAISLGIMLCFGGIGSGIGPIIARIWTGDSDKPLRQSISLGYIIGAAGLAATAPLGSLATVTIGGFIRSVGGGISWVFSTQLLLQRAPNEIRGRIFGIEYALFTLMGAIASAVAGILLDLYGVKKVLWGMSILPFIPAIFWWLWQAHYTKVSKNKKMKKTHTSNN